MTKKKQKKSRRNRVRRKTKTELGETGAVDRALRETYALEVNCREQGAWGAKSRRLFDRAFEALKDHDLQRWAQIIARTLLWIAQVLSR